MYWTVAEMIQARAHLPGVLAEFGVFEGRVTEEMYRAAPERTLHLFDTFTGLPARTKHDGETLTRGRFCGNLERVQAKLKGATVVYHVGEFPASFRGKELPPVVWALIDFDLYAPTAAALELTWRALVPGGMILVDDLNNWETPGIRKALDESGLPWAAHGESQAVLHK